MNKPRILLMENSTIVMQFEMPMPEEREVAIFTAAGAEKALSASAGSIRFTFTEWPAMLARQRREKRKKSLLFPSPRGTYRITS